jgi:type III secretory pathway component EscV
MTSKTFFKIGKISLVGYIVTTLGVLIGFPEWLHQICTIIFAVAFLLGWLQKKKENQLDK